MKILIFLFITLFFFTNCNKRRPPTGNYTATFVYESQYQKSDVSVSMFITESTKDWVIANNFFGSNGQDTLYKSKKNIEGIFPGSPSIYIKGKITRDGFSSHFKITGTFIQNVPTQSSGLSEFKGTFTIKK